MTRKLPDLTQAEFELLIACLLLVAQQNLELGTIAADNEACEIRALAGKLNGEPQ
jgi:hypothetical protein